MKTSAKTAPPPTGRPYAERRAQMQRWLSAQKPGDFEDAVLQARGIIAEWPEEERRRAERIIEECQGTFKRRMRKVEQMRRQVFECVTGIKRGDALDAERLRRLERLWQERRRAWSGPWPAYIADAWDEAAERAVAE